MPRQDEHGRWISDDGLYRWDGSAWRPVGQPAAARRGVSALPAVIIGCGFGLALVIVLVIGGFILVGTPQFKQQFCQTWQNNPRDAATPCPIRSSP